LSDIVPSEAIQEISVYFCHSFGDRQRIDYGTGHEANFAAFL
jgi:serine/threonine-protein phosphatase 2A activator